MKGQPRKGSRHKFIPFNKKILFFKEALEAIVAGITAVEQYSMFEFQQHDTLLWSWSVKERSLSAHLSKFMEWSWVVRNSLADMQSRLETKPV